MGVAYNKNNSIDSQYKDMGLDVVHKKKPHLDIGLGVLVHESRVYLGMCVRV